MTSWALQAPLLGAKSAGPAAPPPPLSLPSLCGRMLLLSTWGGCPDECHLGEGTRVAGPSPSDN